MVEQILVSDDNFYIPDASKLVTEDDTPVDNFASEKQQRLLVSSLYSSLQNQTFLAAANVGIYHIYKQPPIVPDVFVSFDVQVPENWWDKNNRCYLVWEFGKPPEVVIEIVSNKIGDELGDKLKTYEHMRVSYYIVYDPTQQLGEKLRIYQLVGRRYQEISENWLEHIELGLTLWEGEFEGRQDTWLRWCYQDGTVVPTGDERAKTAEQQAEDEKQQKEQALSRAELLAEKLREMGINPDDL
ncbi:MAG: Uma2 family endonuclease [Cyanobacteria bacterium P01_D01_bin.50]